MSVRRATRNYDHRLVRLVQETGDPTIATRLGVPRSTAAGWVRRAPRSVVTDAKLDATHADLLVRVARLEQRVRRLIALVRFLVALVRIAQPNLTRLRVPAAGDKARPLRAIERSREVLGLRRVLRIVGLSPSRLAAWRRASVACELDDASWCPRSSPQWLTLDEVAEMRAMTTAGEFRHVPTGRLAALARRLGRVVASASTWHRLVREPAQCCGVRTPSARSARSPRSSRTRRRAAAACRRSRATARSRGGSRLRRPSAGDLHAPPHRLAILTVPAGPNETPALPQGFHRRAPPSGTQTRDA